MELKKRLSSEPVLAFGQEFEVEVDASDCAFGGVLLQKGIANKFHPVAYFSDSVQSSPKNWAPTTKEARGKFARWILELEEYDYVIRYIPGTKNVKAVTP